MDILLKSIHLIAITLELGVYLGNRDMVLFGTGFFYMSTNFLFQIIGLQENVGWD